MEPIGSPQKRKQFKVMDKQQYLYDKGVIDSFCPPDEEILKKPEQASPATIDKAKNLREVMNLVQESDEEASVEDGKASGGRVVEEQDKVEVQQE